MRGQLLLWFMAVCLRRGKNGRAAGRACHDSGYGFEELNEIDEGVGVGDFVMSGRGGYDGE